MQQENWIKSQEIFQSIFINDFSGKMPGKFEEKSPKHKEIFFAKCLFCKSFRKFKLAINFILFVSFMKAQLEMLSWKYFQTTAKRG